jgi:hypothetical protein
VALVAAEDATQSFSTQVVERTGVWRFSRARQLGKSGVVQVCVHSMSAVLFLSGHSSPPAFTASQVLEFYYEMARTHRAPIYRANEPRQEYSSSLLFAS